MDLLKLIFSLLLGFLKGILWGGLFLFVAVIILPENILLKLLNIFKTNLVLKNKVFTKTRLFFDFLFGNKSIVHESESPISINFQKNMTELMNEKRAIESNVFFLDLLKNLSDIIFFSSSQRGDNERATLELIERAMEYLIYYSSQLKNSQKSKKIKDRIDSESENLQNKLNDLIAFLSKKNSEGQIKKAILSLKKDISLFNDSMKNEYDSTLRDLKNINQQIADNFINLLEEK